MASAGASFLSFNSYLVPVIGVLSGALMLGETIHPDLVLALAVILAGVFCANMPRGRTRIGENRTR